jgi:LysR family glycine cleavage system transcriptional activator
MADFLRANPGIALSLSTTTTMLEFELDTVDLAVRYFDGTDPRLSVQLLCRDEARACCHPAYAEKHALRRPEDLASATLLHNTLHPHWPAWLARFNALAQAQVQAIAGVQFEQSLMAIDAAVRVPGVVLTRAVLVEAELARGELIEPFDNALPLSAGYYLVQPDTTGPAPAVQSLKAWFARRMAAAPLR